MKSLIASLLVAASLCPLRAFAALGGDAASIDIDRSQMKASVQSKQTSTYTVHQLAIPGGTVVREYLSSAGNVFAVAWQGPFMPDMQRLLGSYFDQYSAAIKANKQTYTGRHPLNLQLSGLIVQKNGYMRNYHFRAYLPQQVPAGVKQEELW